MKAGGRPSSSVSSCRSRQEYPSIRRRRQRRFIPLDRGGLLEETLKTSFNWSAYTHKVWWLLHYTCYEQSLYTKPGTTSVAVPCMTRKKFHRTTISQHMGGKWLRIKGCGGWQSYMWNMGLMVAVGGGRSCEQEKHDWSDNNWNIWSNKSWKLFPFIAR